jgi:Xaa-Pro dipeptidase
MGRIKPFLVLADKDFRGYDAGMDYNNSAALGGPYAEHIATLKTRHDRALERAGANHAVIFAGAPIGVFLDDNDYPFKANPHFVSWVPLTATPFSYIVYTPGETPILIYYQPRDYWHSVPADPKGFWTGHFDVRIVHSLDDIPAHLPVDRDKCIFIGELVEDGHAFGIERTNPQTALNILHYARASKTAYELECMRAASRRGVRGHRAAEAAFREGMSEFGIHLDYCRATGHREDELPYGNIVALNENGAVLHHQHLAHDAPARRRSFLIDAGAGVNGYASDITRTYSANQDEFAELIDRFDKLQLELVAEVKTGVNFVELHLSCHRKIGALLVEIGLASGTVEALMAEGVTSAFYPHGLGHLLGLQVHDIGGHMGDDAGSIVDPPSGHPFLRLTRVLEPDMVLTIEPGLYVIDMLINNLDGTPGRDMLNQKKLDWLRPYGGIRIEDNVRVLDDGCENLTRQAFAGS